MAFINADTPVIKCLMRREFLYDLQDHHGEFEPVNVFGVCSLRGRALLFHVMTERGAQFARVPLHALVHKEDAPLLDLGALELWDAFGYTFGVHQFAYLKDLSCRARLRGMDGLFRGEYMFTLDWCSADDGVDKTYSEIPDEHKNAHVLKLENGCFAALPNNRIFWSEPSFITKPFAEDEKPDFRTNSRNWSVESYWHATDDTRFFYGVETTGGDGGD